MIWDHCLGQVTGEDHRLIDHQAAAVVGERQDLLAVDEEAIILGHAHVEVDAGLSYGCHPDRLVATDDRVPMQGDFLTTMFADQGHRGAQGHRGDDKSMLAENQHVVAVEVSRHRRVKVAEGHDQRFEPIGADRQQPGPFAHTLIDFETSEEVGVEGQLVELGVVRCCGDQV